MLYRTGSPVQARAVPWGADMMTIVWTAGGPSLRGACFGCGDLLAVVDVLGVRRASVRFEGGARNVPIDADIVMREGASRAALLDDLPRVLEERFRPEPRLSNRHRAVPGRWFSEAPSANCRRTTSSAASACCTCSPTAGTNVDRAAEAHLATSGSWPS